MRKIKSLLLVAVLLLASVPAAGMECTLGLAFRDQQGNLLDCLEGVGSDCMNCRMIIIVN